MKNLGLAALGAAVVAAIGASSAAQAADIDFGVVALGGKPVYSGPRLDLSTAFDFKDAVLLVSSVGPGDGSGLAPFETVSLLPTDIEYGSGSGTALDTPLGADVVKSWTDSLGSFTETLTTVLAINRSTANAITITLGGTFFGPGFDNTPAFLILSATQVEGPGTAISASFTNSGSLAAAPEASTWTMMGLGFAALGYAASRRRKANVAVFSA